jgi:hypothetical protein
MSTQSGRRSCILVAMAVVLTLAVVTVVVWGTFRLGADDWEWRRPPEPPWERCAASIGIFVLLGGFALLAWRRVDSASAWQQVAFIAGFVCLGAAAQIAMLRQTPAGFHEGVMAIAQPGANRYHKAARGVENLASVLEDYPAWMRADSHALVITNPGGPLTVFWSLNHVFSGDEAGAAAFAEWCEDTFTEGVRLAGSPWAARLFADMTAAEIAGAWLATLIFPCFASLVAIPAYLLASSLYGRREGVLAAAFSLAVPSLVLFSPGLDQCYPVLAATAAWLAHSAGRRQSLLMAGLSGLVLSVGFFFSLAFAVAALLAGLLALVGLVQSETKASPKTVAGLTVAAVTGFFVPVLVLRMILGYRSFAVWQGCLEANAEFNAASQRGYWTWLMLNPVEFAVFLGLPAACLLAWRLFGKESLAAQLVVGLLVLVNILGLNRGEVARLWLFLMPVCVAVGVAEIERAAPYRRIVFIVLFALQAGQAVVFRAVLQVLNIV